MVAVADPMYAMMRVLESASDTDQDTARVGIELTNAVKVMLSRPGTGRMYGTHQASAPGQPPAVDTGIYRASWQWDRDTNQVRVFSHGAEPFERPEWLEFGTSRMDARPHLRPAVAEYARFIPSVFYAGIMRREQTQARKEGGS